MIYDISYKTLIGPKRLHIIFDKIDGFIRIYDRTRYLVLFGPEKFDAIFNRIRYLKSSKSSITYVFSHYNMKISVGSYYSLPLEKTLTLHNVITLIKSVLNKDQNHYYYNIFLEKCITKLKNNLGVFFDSVIMLRFREAKNSKIKISCWKKKKQQQQQYLGCYC